MIKNQVLENRDYLRMDFNPKTSVDSYAISDKRNDLLSVTRRGIEVTTAIKHSMQYTSPWLDILVDPADEQILYTGIPFGVRGNSEKVNAVKGVIRVKSRLPSLPDEVRTLSGQAPGYESPVHWWRDNNSEGSGVIFHFTHTVPGTLFYTEGAEAKAAAKIQQLFTEAYTELFYGAFIHSKNIVDFFKAYDYSTLVGANSEQREAVVRTFTSLHISESNKEMVASATSGINALVELDADFKRAGASVSNTLAVCARRIKGTFGKDWYLDGYWDTPVTQKFHESTSDKLKVAEQQVQDARHGYPRTHFTIDQLTKDVIKANPQLQTIYASDIGTLYRH